MRMNYRNIVALSFVLQAACSMTHRRPGSGAGSVSGSFPAGPSLTIDGGVGNVTLRVGEIRDSVRWSLTTDPPACAAADISTGRIAVKDRARTCGIAWEVSTPAVDYVAVGVSVGDINLTAPADRAVRLKSGVGNVRLSLDGRELRHAGAPGSGDELELGDLNTRPLISATTGVGTVRAMLSSVPASRRP